MNLSGKNIMCMFVKLIFDKLSLYYVYFVHGGMYRVVKDVWDIKDNEPIFKGNK